MIALIKQLVGRWSIARLEVIQGPFDDPASGFTQQLGQFRFALVHGRRRWWLVKKAMHEPGHPDEHGPGFVKACASQASAGNRCNTAPIPKKDTSVINRLAVAVIYAYCGLGVPMVPDQPREASDDGLSALAWRCLIAPKTSYAPC